MQKQPSIWHDSVYHTTSRSQAAALFLTPLRLHDPKMACPIEGQKTGWCFASQEDDRVHVKPRGWVLSRLGGVKLLGHFENRGLIVLLLTPEGKDDPHPHVGAGPEGHRVTFAFGALTLVVIPGPRFRLRALSGKLLQRIAQGLDASVASMGFGILAAFTQHRRSPGQRLQTPGVLLARSVIPDFSQQPLRKPFSSTGKAAENTVGSVDQKMVFDDLLVLGNAFNDRQQLLEQVRHETCLRARGDCVGLQVRSVQLLINLGCHFGRGAVRSFSQGGLQVFDRGRHGTLRSGISLQGSG
jgi:hypothetical protein